MEGRQRALLVEGEITRREFKAKRQNSIKVGHLLFYFPFFKEKKNESYFGRLICNFGKSILIIKV